MKRGMLGSLEVIQIPLGHIFKSRTFGYAVMLSYLIYSCRFFVSVDLRPVSPVLVLKDVFVFVISVIFMLFISSS